MNLYNHLELLDCLRLLFLAGGCAFPIIAAAETQNAQLRAVWLTLDVLGFFLVLTLPTGLR